MGGGKKEEGRERKRGGDAVGRGINFNLVPENKL